MIWKELKQGQYKNYSYCIFGKYTEDYITNFRGTIYKENIATAIEIRNPLGEVVHKTDWYDQCFSAISYEGFKYLIHFREAYDNKWSKFLNRTTSVIHIEDDYTRVLNDWVKYCESYIDKNIKEFEQEKYEQKMTDGLPDSVFKLYMDN